MRPAPGGGADDRGDGGGDAQRGVLPPGDNWLGEDGRAGRVRRACPRLERAVLALRDRLCTDHPACLPFPLPAPGGAPQPPALHHRLYLRLRLLQMIEACGGYRAGIKRRALLPLPGFARRFMPLPAAALLEVFKHAFLAVQAVTWEDLRFVLDFFSSRWRAEAGEAVRAREIARVRAHEAVRATAAWAAARPGPARGRARRAADAADDALHLAREASQEAAVQAARTAADEAVVAARDAEAAAVRARDAARPVAAVADAPPSLAEADAAAVSARASVDASSRVGRALAAMASPLAPHTAEAVLARLDIFVARIGSDAANAADRALYAARRAAQQASADASAWEVLLADEVSRRRARPFALFAMAATLAAVRDGAAAEAAARASRVGLVGAAADVAVRARHAADRAAAAVSAAVQAGPGAYVRTCRRVRRAADAAVRITRRVIRKWSVAAPPPPPRPPGGPAVLDAYFADIIAALTQADDGPPLSDAAQAARDALEGFRADNRVRGQARRRAVDEGHRGRGGPPGRDVRPHPPAAARADVADDLTLDASANLFAWRLLAYAHGPTFTGETGSTYFALSAATDGKSINVRMVKRRRGGPVIIGARGWDHMRRGRRFHRVLAEEETRAADAAMMNALEALGISAGRRPDCHPALAFSRSVLDPGRTDLAVGLVIDPAQDGAVLQKVSSKEMRARSGVTERERREAGEARAPGVARALKALGQAGDNKTPTTAHGCVSYMRAALPHVRTLFAYYWNAAQARAAFNATAAKQRATRALAERLAPPPPGWDPGRDRPPPGARRTPADTRLVVMGAADFKPAVRGSRGAFKSLASAIAALPWVVMIFFPEDLTSATCSACGRRLLPVYGTKTVVVRGPDGGHTHPRTQGRECVGAEAVPQHGLREDLEARRQRGAQHGCRLCRPDGERGRPCRVLGQARLGGRPSNAPPTLRCGRPT